MDPVTRMHNAQRIVDDELFQEAFIKVEAAIIDQLKGPATPQDVDLLMALRLVPKIKGWLIGQIQTGKVELNIRNTEEAKRGRK